MAQPLDYRPEVRPSAEASDAWQELLEALHERGLLRLGTALARQLPEVATVALRQLDTERGRAGAASLAVLGRTFSELDPDALERLLEAAKDGLSEAGEKVKGEPPGVFALLGRSNDEDVRRGLWAALTFLGAMGRALDGAGARESD